MLCAFSAHPLLEHEYSEIPYVWVYVLNIATQEKVGIAATKVSTLFPARPDFMGDRLQEMELPEGPPARGTTGTGAGIAYRGACRLCYRGVPRRLFKPTRL